MHIHRVSSSVDNKSWLCLSEIGHSMDMGCPKAGITLDKVTSHSLVSDDDLSKPVSSGRPTSWLFPLSCIALCACIGMIAPHEITLRELDRQILELKAVCAQNDGVPFKRLAASSSIELLFIVRASEGRRSRPVRAIDPVEVLRERSDQYREAEVGTNLWYNLQTKKLVDQTRKEITELREYTWENALSELLRKGGSARSKSQIRSIASNDIVDPSSHQQGYFWFDFDELKRKQAGNGSRVYSDPQHRYVQGVPLQVRHWRDCLRMQMNDRAVFFFNLQSSRVFYLT